MPIYHVRIDLVNPDDPDENGTYAYGVRHWSARGAVASVVERATSDGYLVGDDRTPRVEKVGSDIKWDVALPICYGKESP